MYLAKSELKEMLMAKAILPLPIAKPLPVEHRTAEQRTAKPIRSELAKQRTALEEDGKMPE